MKPSGIILTGSSGYLGKELLKFIDHDLLLICTKKSFYDKEPVFFNYEKKEIKNIKTKYSSFIIVHLATYFSKDSYDNDMIFDANIKYGTNLINIIESLKIQKFIYTNTMFNFYSDHNIRELHYTKTKMQFSELLDSHSDKNNYYVDEIFLDNNFGGIDKRNKVVPNIVSSILEKKPSPVVNRDAHINLIYYQDVVKRILLSTNSEINGSTAFINKKSLNVQSIYDFLHCYDKYKIFKPDLLLFNDNDYLKKRPRINYYDIEISSIPEKLISYLVKSGKRL